MAACGNRARGGIQNPDGLLTIEVGGTTIPLYDKRKNLYNRPVETVTVK